LAKPPPFIAFLRRGAFVALLLALLFACTYKSCLAARVKEVRQNINLDGNGRLAVEETVTIDQGAVSAPFIRRIATLYKRAGQVCNRSAYVKSVADAAGHPLPFTSKNAQGYEIISVAATAADATSKQPVRTIVLKYDLTNSVNFVAGKPELFYSALGREWSEPIDKVTLTINLLPSQSALASHTTSYIGAFAAGNHKHGRTKIDGTAVHVSCDHLASGVDLIAVVPLPQSTVTANNWQHILADLYQTSKLAVLLPVGTLAALFLLWLLIGCDQRFGKKPVFVLDAPWQPANDVSPAEVGAIIDETCDDKDILATIFDLAQRGYLAVREVPSHGAVNYGQKDYEFSQPPQPVKGELKAHEELIINVIFSGRNKSYLSDMRGYFFDYMPILRNQVLTGLARDKYFARNPQADRDYFVSFATCIMGLGAVLFAYSVIISDTYKTLSYSIVLSGLLILLASGFMPKRTRKGVAVIEQTHHFEHFILHSKDREIEDAFERDPSVFFRFLPHAIVLGMAEFWGARFKAVVKTYPLWYTSLEQIEGQSQYFDSEILVREIIFALEAIQRIANAHPENKTTSSKSSPGSSRNLP